MKSKGKYIIWINSDDIILHKGAAKNVVQIFKEI